MPLGMHHARCAHITLLAAQDPEAVALKEKFERDLVKAEEAMIQRNAQATSRARHEPTGVPYTLLYPSTATNPVTTDNRGMTGCGIPCVAPTYPHSCAVAPVCACMLSTGKPALTARRLACL